MSRAGNPLLPGIVAGCKKCPAFTGCLLKTLIGDHLKDADKRSVDLPVLLLVLALVSRVAAIGDSLGRKSQEISAFSPEPRSGGR
jgi:hypothetical protein